MSAIQVSSKKTYYLEDVKNIDEYYDKFISELRRVLKRDDVEGFLDLLNTFPDERLGGLVRDCVEHNAINCLKAVLKGDLCHPLPGEDPSCATSIHYVAFYYADPDILTIMLTQGGATVDLDIESFVVSYFFDGNYSNGTPLCLALKGIDGIGRGLNLPIDSWFPGDSIYKLIVLLSMWEQKQRLDSVRLLASYTDVFTINHLAWTFLRNGNLKQFAALLLVAREKVMTPLEKGVTIRQLIVNEIDGLSSEVDIDRERAKYKSILMDAHQLIDITERVGDALGSYRASMFKNVPPEKVLVDVVCLLKRAGFSLQVVDIDLRDCYRDHRTFWKPYWLELADNSRTDNKFFQMNPGAVMPFANILSDHNGKLICRQWHWNPVVRFTKSGKMLNMVGSAPNPRMLNTVADSSFQLKRLAYVALKLKRGIKML